MELLIRILTTALLGFSLCFDSLAQTRPEALIKKAETTPVIDGQSEAAWDIAEKHSIDKNFQNEQPTIGNSTWQMLWSDGGLYLLLIIDDDDFYPHYVTGGNVWEFDNPEIYFDVNEVLEDGGGASGEPDNGHHQVAPPFKDGFNNGTLLVAEFDPPVEYAFLVNDPDYTAEYFIPFSYLTDDNGNEVTIANDIGFDVQIIDRDAGDSFRNRAVWANRGILDESWNDMDDCGIIRLEGAPQIVYIESLEIDGGSITENNGQLVIVPEILPSDAWEGKLVWSIENVTGRALVNGGVVTGVADGKVIVKVSSRFEEDTALVTIENQVVSLPEINLIRNGFFDDVTIAGTAEEWSGYFQVIDGAMYLPAPLTQHLYWWEDSWTKQSGFGCNPTDPYQFSFVLWSEAADTFYCVFDDPNNSYNRYGSSLHEYTSGLNEVWTDGSSQWDFVTTTEPAQYVFDVVFDGLLGNTLETLNLMGGLHNAGGIYIDSVVLVSTNDLSLITHYKPVESIAVSVADGDTTVNMGGTLQMMAEVLPVDADFREKVHWSVEPGTGKASISDSGLLTADSLGTVTVRATATDDSKATGELLITILECNLYDILIEADITSATCLGISDGSIDITHADYDGELIFMWSNGVESEDLDSISSGQYQLTITEPGNCSRKDIFVVSDSMTILMDTMIITPPSCSGDSNGSVYLEVSNGTAPYLFDVNGNGSESDGTNNSGSLGSGPLSIVVVDADGCMLLIDTVITQPQLLQIELIPSETLCYDDSTGQINATVTGGTKDYTYHWNTGSLTEDLANLAAGKYQLSVIDANGCTALDSTEIQSYEEILTGDIGGLRIVQESEIAIYSVPQNAGSEFHWSVSGGNIISGQLSNIVTVHWVIPGIGNVSVCEVDAHNCQGDTVSLEVGIEALAAREQNGAPPVWIYPVPAGNTLVIEGADIMNSLVEITDLNGQQVYSTRVKTEMYILDLSGLQKGLYLITIRSKDFVTTRKIIKL
jgi:hypothetical protein